jgi:WD40 repeat protein
MTAFVSPSFVVLLSRFALGLLPCILTVPAKAEEPARMRRDALGDPLPEGALYRVGTTRLRHGDNGASLRQLAFRPDGKVLLSGGAEDVCFWDTATGREIRRVNANGKYSSFAVSTDGTRLAVAGLSNPLPQIALYDAATGESVRQILTSLIEMPLLAFSPDGKSLLAGTSSAVLRWDIASGKTLKPCGGSENLLLALSADTRTAAFFGIRDGNIRLLETAGGKKIRQWKAPGDVLLDPSSSPRARRPRSNY